MLTKKGEEAHFAIDLHASDVHGFTVSCLHPPATAECEQPDDEGDTNPDDRTRYVIAAPLVAREE
jgi:hypothetical protein